MSRIHRVYYTLVLLSAVLILTVGVVVFHKKTTAPHNDHVESLRRHHSLLARKQRLNGTKSANVVDTVPSQNDDQRTQQYKIDLQNRDIGIEASLDTGTQAIKKEGKKGSSRGKFPTPEKTILETAHRTGTDWNQDGLPKHLAENNTTLDQPDSIDQFVLTKHSSPDHSSEPAHSNDSKQGPITMMPEPHPIPFIGSDHCEDSFCMEYLTSTDRSVYDQCNTKTSRLKRRRGATYTQGSCHFMNGTGRATVALTSFPGSGNTWVRGLLEQATGICTGSVYCDMGLRSSGFNGEGVKSGAVLAVKTHKFMSRWTEMNKPVMDKRGFPFFGAAIVVVRNPLDALVAEWNRKQSFRLQTRPQNGTIHVGYVGKEHFREDSAWDEFVRKSSPLWQSHTVAWLVNNTHPVLMVRFEDLKTDLLGQTKRMLQFLGVPLRNENQLQQRLSQDFGTFHRRHHDDFDHFTSEQRELVLGIIRETMGVLRQNNSRSALRIEEYLL